MRYHRKSGMTWLALGAAALCVAGCATEQQTSNSGTVSGRAAPDDTSARAGTRARQPAALYFPTGRSDSSVIMLMVQTPDQVRVGQPYSYEIQVKNLTDAPLAAVTLREVAHRMDAARPTTPEEADRRGSAQEEPARPAEARQGQARPRQDTWEIGTLDPRQTKVVRIEGIEEQEGTAHHCYTVDFQPVACAAVAVVNPQLRLTKVGPERALVCDDLSFRYRVENVGTGIARNVRVVEPLPEGLTTPNGQNVVTFDAGNLGPGESREFTINLKAARPGEFTTRAVVASADGENPARPMTLVLGQPVLDLAIRGREWEYMGRPVAYEVTVTNRGNAAAPNTRVAIEGATAEGGTPQRDLGTIPPGESRQVTINATPARPSASAAGPSVVQVAVTATADCARPATEMARTEIRTISALLIECVDTNDPVRVGDVTSYQIVVKNQGSGPARNIALRASLPPEMEFVGATGSTPIRVDGKTLIFATVASLPAGQSATWTVNARALSDASVQFQLEMKADDIKEAALESEPTTLYK